MKRSVAPLAFLLTAIAGWIQRHQQEVIDYLLEENRILRARMKGRRLRFTEAERARLAKKGRRLGLRALEAFATIVTPETILAWHRRLIAAKWTFKRKGQGRPPVMRRIVELALRFARENEGWGYERIQGALRNLGHKVARSTIAKILVAHGVTPAPERRRRASWRKFLRSHWSAIAAVDFFTTEVWTVRGLVTHYTLFAIHHATRRVAILGTTTRHDSAFRQTAARRLLSFLGALPTRVRFVIHDRDSNLPADFDRALATSRLRVLKTPPHAPNCNAIAERWIRGLREECLDRMVPLGSGFLERAIDQYVEHYHRERNHQGLGNQLLLPKLITRRRKGRILRRDRLGGLLRYYYRDAA